MEQLVSYIAPSAPATRRPATGFEPLVRLEIGFTPRWFNSKLGVDFGKIWHNDPEYRKDTVELMHKELEIRFPGCNIGRISNKPDLLTGTFGACTISAIFGIPIVYSKDNWPNCAHEPLCDSDIYSLIPPNLDENEFFQNLLNQLDWIEKDQGNIIGFINWQGVLNNAHRLRGVEIFTDMFIKPELVLHLMDCVCITMIDACKRIQQRQELSNFNYQFFTISNCLVNMISPEQYKEFVMPFDQKISKSFNTLGIHNCAWNADPYFEHYSNFSNLGYIDMGINSDLVLAKKYFADSRRAIMYTPMDLNSRDVLQIEKDLYHIAECYAPCDLVVADIDECVPDGRVRKLIDIVNEINQNI
jgi:hypothetical protein